MKKVVKKDPRGGARKGAGRPAGAKNVKPAEGRKVVTASISMPPEDWEKLDSQRGELSRGKYVASLL
jgi:hypothetical protein